MVWLLGLTLLTHFRTYLIQSCALIDITIVFRIPRRWRDVDLTVVSVPGKEVSLHECLADVYVVAEHVVLSRQGKNSAEPAGVRPLDPPL